LETARVPHADRHGLVFLDRGALYVVDGCLRFDAAGGGMIDRGKYVIPHQSMSMLLLGPGSTVSHDALRLLTRHGTGLVAIGEDGVRQYTGVPFLPDTSSLARRQAQLWADARHGRMLVARRMYARRLGIIMPHRDIATLRGIEGARARAMYAKLAEKHGVEWKGRVYDRQDPQAADDINQAINHAASAVEGAAAIAVTATSTIPQLGFIHEDSGQSFVLDVADLYRDSVTLPCAFRSIAAQRERPGQPFERIVRKLVGTTLRKQAVIPAMIDVIKDLFAEETSREKRDRREPLPAESSASESTREGEDAADDRGHA
jgi:CRISPR-associated protein Cas1